MKAAHQRCVRCRVNLAKDPWGELCRGCLGEAFPGGAPEVRSIQRAHANGDGPASTLARPTSSWLPVDLGAVMEGDGEDLPPEILARSDGVALFYRGRVHMVVGEPEAGKGWLVLRACAERLMLGEHVLYVDFEDTAAAIVSRLRALGVPDDRILEFFHYVRPDERLNVDAQTICPEATLVVIDGTTEALALFGLKLESNVDAAELLKTIARPFADQRAAVAIVDHVPKDREKRTRGGIGAQHKLAGTDVTYVVKAIAPFGRGLSGLSKLLVDKDRPGFLRAASSAAKVAAEIRFVSDPDTGAMTISVDPVAEEGGWRPTRLMEAVSRYLERWGEQTRSGVETGVRGRAVNIRDAIAALEADGYVTTRSGPRNAILIVSTKPYREGEE